MPAKHSLKLSFGFNWWVMHFGLEYIREWVGDSTIFRSCASEGCYRFAESGSDYCNEHKLISLVPSSLSLLLSPPLRGIYCASEGCCRVAESGSDYCEKHILVPFGVKVCTFGDCSVVAKSGSNYCELHELNNEISRLQDLLISRNSDK